MRLCVPFILFALAAAGQTRTLTLKKAVDLALEQNPDLLMARLDEQKAAFGVKAASESLLPRVYAGSGLAYTYGFPVSLDGSAPSIFQARADRSLYNAPSRLLVAQAKEQARGAAAGAGDVREDVALRVAMLFLDLERSVRTRTALSRQIESLARVEAAVRLRVAEGKELAIEGKRAAANLVRAKQRLGVAEGDIAAQSRVLASALGLPPGQSVEPELEQRLGPGLPESENAAIDQALSGSGQLRRLESDAQAQSLAARASRARRLPSVNLVAQYSLLGKFNNYEDFFRRFQRHNAQIGASVAIPLWADPRDEATAAQADLEARRIRMQAAALRTKIESESRQAWQKVRDAETYREVAKLDLEVAREQTGIVLAQFEEGRAGLKALEEARIAEQDRWVAYDQAGCELEKARLEVLRRTGQLTASLR